MTVYGITENLPYIVYFDQTPNNQKVTPLVEDLCFIHWSSNQATNTSLNYLELVKLH